MKRALVAALLLAGCTVGHAYTVDRAALASGIDPIPAVRIQDGAAVRVHAADIDRSSLRVDGERPTVKTRRYSPMVTAGSVLTWIGSAISIAGTTMFLATNTGDVHLAGLILAPSAEPLMIAGTVLWIVGLIRHPEEAR
jgi:hypothetical protein